jgi:hypothetical protein
LPGADAGCDRPTRAITVRVRIEKVYCVGVQSVGGILRDWRMCSSGIYMRFLVFVINHPVYYVRWVMKTILASKKKGVRHKQMIFVHTFLTRNYNHRRYKVLLYLWNFLTH